MDVDMEQDDYMSPKIEINDSVTNRDPKDELLSVLDKVEALVEDLRRQSFRLEERKDTLFTTLDAIRNSGQLISLPDMDKDDIERYLERVTARCMTVDITVRTDRDQYQEEALYQVNKYIDSLVVSFKVDPENTMLRCESYLAACKDSPEVPADKGFESALLGCALDDQKRIKKRLFGLLDYLGKNKLTLLTD